MVSLDCVVPKFENAHLYFLIWFAVLHCYDALFLTHTDHLNHIQSSKFKKGDSKLISVLGSCEVILKRSKTEHRHLEEL